MRDVAGRFYVYRHDSVVKPDAVADTFSGAIEDALAMAREHGLSEFEVAQPISQTILAYCHPGGQVRFTSACLRSRRYDSVRAAWAANVAS